jgi:hypothetical protein
MNLITKYNLIKCKMLLELHESLYHSLTISYIEGKETNCFIVLYKNNCDRQYQMDLYSGVRVDGIDDV